MPTHDLVIQENYGLFNFTNPVMPPERFDIADDLFIGKIDSRTAKLCSILAIPRVIRSTLRTVKEVTSTPSSESFGNQRRCIDGIPTSDCQSNEILVRKGASNVLPRPGDGMIDSSEF